MRFASLFVGFAAASFQLLLVSGLSISEINGHKFLSSYAGQVVACVKGMVTAKGPSGFWIRSTTLDLDYRSSNSIYVFGSSAGKNLTVGDVVTLDATVSEYRSSSTYLFLTELTAPKNVTVIDRGANVTPIVIGEWLLKWPLTERYTSLDKGDVFGLPNNSSQISVQNPSLQPLIYGLDFWESMCGELVTVRKPTAIAKPNSYGDTWVVGSWRTSGRNKRGGLTLTDGGISLSDSLNPSLEASR